MDMETWLPFYERICIDFGFDPSRDLQCAQALANILGERSDASLERVKDRLSPIVLVCGGSGSLADELSSTDVRWPVVAADSATTVLLEADITPDIIVTDLDGVVEDQLDCNSRGVPVMVHAHGDNRRMVERYARKFRGAVTGTCQCPPPAHMFNFGGFTDGDRAACICSGLGARTILLAGFDFENPSRKPGKSRDVKKRKLSWARRILDELVAEGINVVPISGYEVR
jgi:uncharacterized Rossmann fold enzyme